MTNIVVLISAYSLAETQKRGINMSLSKFHMKSKRVCCMYIPAGHFQLPGLAGLAELVTPQHQVEQLAGSANQKH